MWEYIKWSVGWKCSILGNFRGRKLSRIRGFTAVHKSFTAKFGGVASFCSTSEQSAKVSKFPAIRWIKAVQSPTEVRKCTVSTKHLHPSLPSLSPPSLLSAVFTSNKLLVVVSEMYGDEREALDIVPVITTALLAGGTPAGNGDHSGSGPRNNPHQLPRRETTCAPTRLIPSWRSRPNLCCLQLVANTTENCFCYNILTTRVPPQLI